MLLSKILLFKQDFIEVTKNGINLYSDNVGGEILELALDQASDFATITICGCISIYNKTEVPVEIRNYIHIVNVVSSALTAPRYSVKLLLSLLPG